MTVASVTVGISVVLNFFGALGSIAIERYGLPAALDEQTVRRRGPKLGRRWTVIAVNLLLIWTLTYTGLTLYAEWFPMGWPGTFTWAAQLLVLLLVDDAVFYWVHRNLHTNLWLYRNVHHRHHEAYAPIPLEYIYVHPMEWMIGMSGFVAGLAVCFPIWGGVSAWALWVWGAWRTFHELDIHSGMNLGTKYLPFFAPMKHHDVHHAKPHDGNYSSMFPWWDHIMGTAVTDDVPSYRERTGN